MIPYLLAVAGGYLIGNAFKDSGGEVQDKIEVLEKALKNPVTPDSAKEKIKEKIEKLKKYKASMAEGGMMAKDYYIVKENGNPIFYNLSIENAKRIVAENPSERSMMKQKDTEDYYIVKENGNPIFYNLSLESAKRIVAQNPSERSMMEQMDDMMAKGGKIHYDYTNAHGYTVYQDGKAIESFKTEERAKIFAKDLEKGMSYAYQRNFKS